jgi:hypothetical protein
MHPAAFLMILLQFLLASWSLAQDKAPGFAGKWLRDDVVTQNRNHLPRETWEITFDEKTMTRRVFSEHSEDVPIFVYNLDPTDTSIDVPNCYGRRRILRLKKMQSEEIEVTEILPGCGSSTSGGMFIAEIWKLTNDGNTLSTVRKFRSADPKIQIRNIDQKYSLQKVQPSSDH